MEALIILVGQFLLLPIIAGLSALVSLVAGILGIIAEVIFGITRSKTPKEPSDPIKIPPWVVKGLSRITLGILGTIIAALLILNFFFLETTIRFAADKAEEKTGIEIDYEFIEGNLFTGRFVFEDLQLQRSGSGDSDFEIEINAIKAELPITQLLFGKREINQLSVLGGEIDFHLRGQKQAPANDRELKVGAAVTLNDKRIDGVAVTTRPKILDTPNYKIRKLRLEQISINVMDESGMNPTSYQIEIDRLSASPLRSHFAILDILFRTNLDATLNESKIEIVNTEKDGQRQTRWATQDVPADVLASLVGGPFSLFESGKVDVEVNDEWDTQRIDSLSLEWKIRVRDAKATLPEGIPSALRPVAQVWVNNINANQKDWKFAFELELSEDRFHGASSLNAKQIWEGAVPVVLKQVADFSGFEESAIKKTTGKAFEKFKGFLKDRSKE